MGAEELTEADGLTDADGLSDRALLRQYVERRSEAAFSGLVRRHLSLVYATCRREVGDPDTAEEVAQAVFLLLARKAPSLRAEAGLAGWLFQTARFAAKNALRREARRQRRERKAAEMMPDTQAAEQAAGEDFWRQVEPHLNDALASLGAADREAVLLRFFEGRSLAEVGGRLGLSENTARMRVARAVEKMRRHLSREGVPLAGIALAALLADRAAPAAPASCLTAALKLAPVPGVLAPPPGPAGAHLYQFTQGVWKAMWIKTITTTTLIAAAFVGLVAVPLVVASVPRAKLVSAKPVSDLHSQSSDRAPVVAAKAAPVLAAPAILSRKQVPGQQAAWTGVVHIRTQKQVREAAGGSAALEPIPTLAAAFGQATPPDEGVALAVGAEKVPLLEGNAPTHKDASLEQVGFAYGRLLRRFGAVSAVAPPTMTLLNTDPGTPNPYDGMPPTDALKILLGTLTDAQWKALTGPGGLSLARLETGTQRSLLQAIFPGESMKLHPAQGAGDGGPVDQDHLPKLTQTNLGQSTLRLGQRVVVGIPIVGKSEWMNSPPEAAGGKPEYEYGGDEGRPKATLYGVIVRQDAPNTLKPSDLDWDEKPWEQPVALAGIRTVGDLIARIGQAARTEMYADRRYEKRAVLWIAPKSRPAPSARAKDLLRALALCVAGAYRRVGSAYVLTDDVIGVGTRRTILIRFAQEAEIARHTALSEAADTLIRAHGGVDALPTLDGQRAFSDSQRRKAAQDNADGYPAMGQGTLIQAPLDQLTPEQQDTARRFVDHWEAHPPQGGHQEELTLSGKLLLMAQPMFQLQSPTLPGTVSLDNYFNISELFHPSSKLEQEMRQKQAQSAAKAGPPPTAPAPNPAATPTLAALLAPIPRRAVLARPRTAQDVDALVASLQAVHLNQLWLDVFSEGKSHLDRGLNDAPDILTEALARTKGTGIAIIPTLDLLQWGGDAPEGARDLTMLGETSAQAGAYQQRYEGIIYRGQTPEEAEKQPKPTILAVSPVSPHVRQTLIALVQRLAATRGVAALALRGTVTPGYDQHADPRYSTSDDRLGYTPPLRLAFLRKDHVDPIDLEPENNPVPISADLSLPSFEDQQAMGSASAAWNGFRSDADRDLLQTLLLTARLGAGRRLPFLIKQRRESWRSNWYGLWDDPRTRLPEMSEEMAFGGSDDSTNFAGFAHAQSRTNLYVLDPWTAQSKDSLIAALRQLKLGWDGIVLDFTGSGGNPLPGLVKSLAPPTSTGGEPKP